MAERDVTPPDRSAAGAGSGDRASAGRREGGGRRARTVEKRGDRRQLLQVLGKEGLDAVRRGAGPKDFTFFESEQRPHRPRKAVQEGALLGHRRSISSSGFDLEVVAPSGDQVVVRVSVPHPRTAKTLQQRRDSRACAVRRSNRSVVIFRQRPRLPVRGEFAEGRALSHQFGQGGAYRRDRSFGQAVRGGLSIHGGRNDAC